MTRHPRILAAIDIAVAHGIPRAVAAPPFHRLLWRLGLDVRPPHFEQFGRNAGLMGLVWGSCMTVFAVLYALHLHPGAGLAVIGKVIVVAVVAATVFGLVMATVVRARARKARLPPWEDVAAHGR